MARIIDTFEIIEAADPASWRAWLATHHNASPGGWLVLYKKPNQSSR